MSDNTWSGWLADFGRAAGSYLNPLSYTLPEEYRQVQDRLAQSQQAVQNVQRDVAWRAGLRRDLPLLAAVGAGVGVGTRSLQELIRGAHQSPATRYATGPATLDIPIAVRRDEEEEKTAAVYLQARHTDAVKSGEVAPSPAPAPASSPPAAASPAKMPPSAYSFADSSPWAMPLLFGAGAIPMMAAYKGLDGYFDRMRQQHAEAEYEKSKKDFQRSVLRQYAMGKGWLGPPEKSAVTEAASWTKAAEAYPKGESEKVQRLDTLLKEAFDLVQAGTAGVEKVADGEDSRLRIPLLNVPIPNQLSGGVLAGLGMVAIPSFMAGLSHGSARTHRSLLAKALKKHQQQQWRQQPFELHARPLLMSVEDETNETK